MKALSLSVFILVFGLGVPLAQAQGFSARGNIPAGGNGGDIPVGNRELMAPTHKALLFLAGDNEHENEKEKSGERERGQNRGLENRDRGEHEDQLRKEKRHDEKEKKEREREREDSRNMKNDGGPGAVSGAQRFYIAEPDVPRSDLQQENEAGFIFGSGD